MSRRLRGIRLRLALVLVKRAALLVVLAVIGCGDGLDTPTAAEPEIERSAAPDFGNRMPLPVLWDGGYWWAVDGSVWFASPNTPQGWVRVGNQPWLELPPTGTNGPDRREVARIRRTGSMGAVAVTHDGSTWIVTNGHPYHIWTEIGPVPGGMP